MSDGVVPWIYEDDPETRELLAEEVVREMHSLLDHPGWKRLVKVIDQKVTAGRDEMERTGRDIDIQRGAIKMLRLVKNIPQRAVESATAELDKHRGK